MKLPGLKFLRKKKPSLVQPASEIPAAEKSQFPRPVDMPYEVPYYLGATLNTPKLSAFYRHNSRETRHFRRFAYIRARIAGLFTDGLVTKRKLLMTRFPFRMVIKYGTEIQLSEASTLRFVAEQTSVP